MCWSCISSTCAACPGTGTYKGRRSPDEETQIMKTAFGWVEVDGIRYDHDIVIHTDKSVDKRSKKKSKKYRQQYGHTPLSDNELNFVKKEKPEVVFIGTGQYGDLPVTKDAQKILSKYNTVVLPTPEIVERLRDEGRPFSAVLHVTC